MIDTDAVELYDMDNDLLDNITVSFETLDTCFCYGHCGCAVSCSSIKLIDKIVSCAYHNYYTVW